MIRIDKIRRPIAFSNYAEIYCNSFINPVGKGRHVTPKDEVDKLARKYKTGEKKEFIQYLKRNKYKKIYEIIKGNVSTLNTIITEVKSIFGKLEPFYIVEKGVPKSTEFGNEIAKVFDYKKLRNGKKDIELINYLGVKTCIYCNYDPIITYEKAGNTKALCSLDHFYSQVMYPYLSISLCNIIPSCSSCNQQIKGFKPMDTASFNHPYYSYAYNDRVKFTINKYTIKDVNDNAFTIGIEPNNKGSKEYNTTELFDILQRYNKAKDVVIRIWLLRQMNPESEMANILSNTSRRLGNPISAREYWETQIDFFKDADKTLEKPYNKLKRDIAAEHLITLTP